MPESMLAIFVRSLFLQLSGVGRNPSQIAVFRRCEIIIRQKKIVRSCEIILSRLCSTFLQSVLKQLETLIVIG
jgi:hypothetical protein